MAGGSAGTNRPVVWVVGASRGIGRAIARQFALIGCDVCLTARNRTQLGSAVKEIRSLGGHANAWPCDITDARLVFSTERSIRRAVGSVDVLVNNAGVTVFKNFQKTSLKEFEAILDTNLLGQIVCVKAVLPSMIAGRRGWIFNVGSNAAVKTFVGSSAYTAAKAGFLGFSKVLREELKGYNIRVVSVLPGPTETEMWSREDRKRFRHRMMSPKSVAEAIVALYQMPPDVVTDEIILRPIQGDIE